MIFNRIVLIILYLFFGFVAVGFLEEYDSTFSIIFVLIFYPIILFGIFVFEIVDFALELGKKIKNVILK